jgi:hypothetical protein
MAASEHGPELQNETPSSPLDERPSVTLPKKDFSHTAACPMAEETHEAESDVPFEHPGENLSSAEEGKRKGE